MVQRQASTAELLFQTGFSPSSGRSSAKEKSTGRQDVGYPTLSVHKRCGWIVDNHVDERPILCSTKGPCTLPNR